MRLKDTRRKCGWCGEPFTPKVINQLTCSPQCAGEVVWERSRRARPKEEEEMELLPKPEPLPTRQRPCLRCRRLFTIPIGSGVFACPSCQEKD
jgi:hypothetical protein